MARPIAPRSVEGSHSFVKNRVLPYLLGLSTLLTACTWLLPAQPLTPQPGGSPVATASVAAPSAQPGSSVVTLPTTQVPPSPTPAFLVDLSAYRPALKPRFVADVDLVPNATRYDIDVQVHPGISPTLAGAQRVRYTNNESVPLHNLVFRLYPNLPDFGGSMQVGDVIVDGVSARPTFDAGRSAMYVPLSPSLAPGASVVVSLQYSATLPTDTSSGYAVFVNADGVYAMAGFYPTIPVYDAQGWNVEVSPSYGDVTFTDASFYRVQATAPTTLTVVTSGPIVDTVDRGDGTSTWTAVGGPIRDFYIAMADDYQVLREQVDGTWVNSYYRSGQDEGGRLALKYASEALRLFNRKFGEYPYAELDVVPTPTNAGGIEYPGLIVVSESLYVGRGTYFELVVAHEMAHQWWYGLVGSDQLDEPWMDEALANYSMYIYFENTASIDDAQRIRETTFEDAYRELQQNHIDRAIGGPVAGFPNQSDYVAVVYGKGPLFFDAVRKRLGDDAFFAGLRTYLKLHRYGVAYPEDLISAFEKASGQQIDDLYRSWVLGKQP